MKTLFSHSTILPRWHVSSKTIIACLSYLLSLTLQAQDIEWDRTIGGTNDDEFNSLQQTIDGGYILGGYSHSGISGDKSEASRGESDFWIVKLDASGKKEWDKTYGGSSFDILQSIKQTRDGGYILGGLSSSDISGDKSEASRGADDYWIIKLDANGNKEWDRTFGGNNEDIFTSLQQTSDGGYILGGFSDSGISGDKSEAQKGPGDSLVYDFWVVKIDKSGNKEWDRTLGGDDRDILNALQQTLDGGYILGGSSSSGACGDKSEASRGGSDFWIVKLDENGDKEWDKTYGGDNGEGIGSLQQLSLEQTSGGGYILGGGSASGISGDKTEASRGGSDYWVVKIDTAGAKEWDKTFGGDSEDYNVSLDQTQDDGFILGGTSISGVSGEKSEPSADYNDDYWIVKINANGELEWEETIGGDNIDLFQSLQQTRDGGYILGGSSLSGVGRDKTEPNYATIHRESADYWIVKLSPDRPCTPPTPSIAVVPTSNVYTGGPATTIYLGYGPQSVQLVASGAERYEWSPAAGLSDTTIANPVFTPTAPGTYRFTVTAYNGTCWATASVEIEVVDVRCGNNKVTLCHRGRAICIPPFAVAAHLKHHPGDRLGTCGSKQPDYAAPGFIVFPNPINSLADIVWTLQEEGTFRIELYNANGLFVKQLARGSGEAGQEMQQQLDATRLPKGVYYLRLITSEEVRTIRLVVNK